jgi:hypothetical protein
MALLVFAVAIDGGGVSYSIRVDQEQIESGDLFDIVLTADNWREVLRIIAECPECEDCKGENAPTA